MQKSEIATLAGGCFWCTEAVFERLKGVTAVMPGYTGGKTENPSYEDISSGNTGHAESIQITFDPQVITYGKLLDVFFALHDPTTLNRQEADVGTQYRSVVFYHDEAQKKIAETKKAQIPKAVTEIVPFTKFYNAEDYHREYYDKNHGAAYCRLVIDPKIKKLYKEFKDATLK